MIDITFQHFLEIILGFTLGIFIIWCQFKSNHRSFLITAFFVAFFLRLVFSIFLLLTVVDYQSIFLLKDDISYDQISEEIAAGLSNDLSGYLSSYSTGFPNPAYFNIGGFAYHFLNFNTFSMRIMNILISCMTIIPIFKMIQENLGEKTAKIVVVLYVIFPMFVLYSGLQIKDIFVDFFTVLIFMHVLRIVNKNYSLWDAALSTIYLMILFSLRRDLAVVIGFFILIMLIFFNNPKSTPIIKFYQYWRIALPVIMISSILAIFIFNSEIGQTILFSLEFRFSQQSELIEAGGGASTLFRIGSFVDIYKIPFAMIFSVLAPLPGSIELASRLDVLPFYHSIGNIFNILILPFVAMGFLKFPKYLQNFGQDLILRWIPLGLWIAISVMNLGSVRYSMTIWIFALIWSSIGVKYIYKNKFFFSLYYLAVIAILPPIYVLLYI